MLTTTFLTSPTNGPEQTAPITGFNFGPKATPHRDGTQGRREMKRAAFVHEAKHANGKTRSLHALGPGVS